MKPIPLQLLAHVVKRLQRSQYLQALADLLIIGYFFLLRPGEYCYKRDENTPFRLQDVSFELSGATCNAATVDLSLLDSASLVHLRFTTQKNGVRDEDITHGTSTDPLLCPCRAVARRVRHLRRHNAATTTPLHTVYTASGSTAIGSQVLTTELRRGLQAFGDSLNILPKEISARALRAGGCMALFRANLSRTNMQLMGRWRSWAMLEYLHRAGTDTSSFASKMLQFGSFKLNKHSPLPLPPDVIPIVQPFVEADAAAG